MYKISTVQLIVQNLYPWREI